MAMKLQLNTMFVTAVHMAYVYSVFAILLVNMCFALYEDQVGLFDWRQQYIGNSKDLYFEQSTHNSKRVFTTTEENVLAALNARTGQIMWRKVFEREDGVISSLLHSSNSLVTISAQGKTVRSWDPNKGHLLWESISQHGMSRPTRERSEAKYIKGHTSLLLEEEIGAIVASSFSTVRMISQSDGSDIWGGEYTVSELNSNIMGVAKLDDRITVFILQQEDSLFISVRHLDIENGKLLEEIKIPAVWMAEKGVACDMVSGTFLVCLIPAERTLKVNNYASKSDLFHTVKLDDLSNLQSTASYTPTIHTLSKQSDNFFIRLNSSHIILATINENSQVQLVREVQKPGFYSEVYLSQQKYIFEVLKDVSNVAESLHINVYKSDDIVNPIKKLETKISMGSHSGMGSPISGAVYAYSKRSDINYRITVVFEEHSLSLIQNMGNNVGKILWVRNEALSGVTSTKMIELPPSASASKLELLHNEFAVLPNSKSLINNVIMHTLIKLCPAQ